LPVPLSHYIRKREFCQEPDFGCDLKLKSGQFKAEKWTLSS
jgi:hypothetical protein